ncbi:hypothetical protein [Amycolatopsis sp. NPDC051061]|uniref:hypothetical protein n=1 Tax=Amycolatopsis sp. NPDC051061 TaxID=3155042 RepID=UPI003446DE8F
MRVTEQVRGQVLGVLCAAAAAQGIGVGLATGDADPTAEQPQEEPAAEQALATASSELAVDALVGPETDRDGLLRTALYHLTNVLELVPPVVRRGFLFQYWLDRSRSLGSEQRTAIAAAAQRSTGGPPVDSAIGSASAWQRYFDLLQVAVTDRAPRELHLFRQVQLTDNRLGLPAVATAGAAMTLLVA